MSLPAEHTDEALRERATVADADSWQNCDLGELLVNLEEGILRVADHFLTTNRCYLLVTRPPSAAEPRPMPKPQRVVLERTLAACDRQKVTALVVGRSPSTISGTLKSALRFMGLSCGGGRVPLILVLAAHDYFSKDTSSARVALLVHRGTTYYVVSVARPDATLEKVLSGAEYQVARLLVEAKTHREIARARGTSQRTVANQLASVFHRLNVSGRLELLHYLVTSP